MGQPKITVNIQNGAIGGVAPSDRNICGLVCTGVATSGLALNTPALIYSLKAAEDLGITSAATPLAYRQIKGFYDAFNLVTGLEVCPLYIMLVADTVTLDDMCDKDFDNGMKKLNDYADGKLRYGAVARKPDGAYTPDLTNAVEQDSIDAVASAQILCNTLSAAHRPMLMFVEQRGFLISALADLEDYETHEERWVRATLGSTLSDGSADVGIEMGLKAGIPLRRNIGRVKTGALLFMNAAYVGDTKVEDLEAGDTIYDKGYGFFISLQDTNGYFVNDDRMACSKTDDYGYLYRGATINELHRLVFRVYSQWRNDEFESEEGGVMSAATIATLIQEVQDAVKNELSADLSKYSDGTYVRVSIDPTQNVVTTGECKITVRGRVYGHFKDFVINLGFEL